MSIFDTDFDKLDEEERERDKFLAKRMVPGWRRGDNDEADDAKADAVKSITNKMASALMESMPDIEGILTSGGSAEDFAKKVSKIAHYKLLKDLFSDDEKLAQTAAEKILERAHGKVSNGPAAQPNININIIDPKSENDRNALARRMAFMEELMRRKSMNIIDVEDAGD